MQKSIQKGDYSNFVLFFKSIVFFLINCFLLVLVFN